MTVELPTLINQGCCRTGLPHRIYLVCQPRKLDRQHIIGSPHHKRSGEFNADTPPSRLARPRPVANSAGRHYVNLLALYALICHLSAYVGRVNGGNGLNRQERSLVAPKRIYPYSFDYIVSQPTGNSALASFVTGKLKNRSNHQTGAAPMTGSLVVIKANPLDEGAGNGQKRYSR